MRPSLSVLALAVLGLLVPPAAAAPAAPVAPAALSARQLAGIRSLISARMQRDHAPGGTFAIGMNGSLAWSEGFGFADLENHVRATPRTAYRTASIGKAMAATAALRLAEAGRLDLDAPIGRYCPRFPEKPWPITARELITHSSGIRHYLPESEDAEGHILRHYDDASDAISIFGADSLKFRPGDDFSYSTWG